MSKSASQVATSSNSCKNNAASNCPIKTPISGKSGIAKCNTAPTTSVSASGNANKTTSGHKITRIPIFGSMAHLAVVGGDAELEVTREHIGRLVCISGAQIGTLRYFGFTKFQEGIWCGIECDSAVGKNDGSVHGQRYFQCKDKYGIFAPVSKVCLVTGNSLLSTSTYSASPTELFSSACAKISSEQRADVVAEENLSTFMRKGELVLELARLETDSKGPPSPSSSSSSVNLPAPATTPVQTNGGEYELFKNGKRLKKDAKRGKYASKLNEQQQQKKRKLDPEQKSWSANSVMKCPTTLLNSIAAHQRYTQLKEEIQSSGAVSSPVQSPPRNFNEAFRGKIPTSTPTRKLPLAQCNTDPRTESDSGRNVEKTISTTSFEEQHTLFYESLITQPNLSLVAEEHSDVRMGLEASSPAKEEEFPFAVPLPPKRPNSISLLPGLSSEESSELGIFGVSTPELIGGDGTSLALSFPTSCCSSPEALDNESSLGLLTPSQLQECWNSNTNEEDLYQHLRSPSVDDLEEFEEEKTVDQDLSSATYSYGSHSHGNSYLSTTIIPSTSHAQSSPLQIPEQEPFSLTTRDASVAEEIPVEISNSQRPHPPLSLRGSGSGYCGSDPLTDSDFNTESEADHDEKSSMLMMPQNRNARVIDGNLYTSHPLMQSKVEVDAEEGDGEGGKRKTLPLDVVSQSASASEMESSGFYSDASERNPSGGSNESTTSGETFHRRHHRNNYSKVTHNDMHPHRQQHYSSSSAQSEPEHSEVISLYNTRMRPLDADHNLDLLNIHPFSRNSATDLTLVATSPIKPPATLDCLISKLEDVDVGEGVDALVHPSNKAPPFDGILTAGEIDSCLSSSSSSSQVLRANNPSATTTPSNSNTPNKSSSAPPNLKSNPVENNPGVLSPSQLPQDTDSNYNSNSNSMLLSSTFTNGNNESYVDVELCSLRTSLQGSPKNKESESDMKSNNEASGLMLIPTSLQLTLNMNNMNGKCAGKTVGDLEEGECINSGSSVRNFQLESSMTTMNTPTSPLLPSLSLLPAGVVVANPGLAAASARSQSVHCIRSLTSPCPNSTANVPATAKTNSQTKVKQGTLLVNTAGARNTQSANASHRKNVLTKEAPVPAKTTTTKSASSKLSSGTSVSSKSGESTSGSARTESRRINRTVASKTDTGLGRGKLGSAGGVSTKENINNSGLTSTNRSIVGSNRSLAGLGTEQRGSNTSATVAAAAKKLNKWDAIMSKINENKNKVKQINVQDVKSKVYGSKPAGTAIAAPHGKAGKMTKGANEEHHPLNPLLHQHNLHNNFSSRSSTASDSSLDEHRAPPPTKHRVKKDTAISRRQISDLSSASDYSASQQVQHQRDQHPHQSQRRSARSNAAGATGGNGRATDKTSSTNHSQDSKKKHSSVNSASAGGLGKLTGLTGASVSTNTTSATGTMPSRNPPPPKTHPAVKPLRDRNRLASTTSKGSTNTLSFNGNANDVSNNATNGSGKQSGTSTPVVDVADVNLIDSDNNNLIISNNILNSNITSINNQQNSQNAVLIQENQGLKDEVSRMATVCADLQEQITRLKAVTLEDHKMLDAKLTLSEKHADAMSVIVQYLDIQRVAAQQKLNKSVDCFKIQKELTVEKEGEVKELRQEIARQKKCREETISVLTQEQEAKEKLYTENMQRIQTECDEKIESVRNESTAEVDKVKEFYRKEIEAIEAKHRELLDEYRKKSPNDLLHEEVRSLQVVVDMRNEEIRKLREDLINYHGTQDDLILTKEQNKAMLAKVEDIEAQLEKARGDKRELQEKFRAMECNFSQLECENSRLSQCNEELCWRIQTLRTDERVSNIMSKSATELGLTNSDEMDYKSTMNALMDSSRIRSTGRDLAIETKIDAI